MTAEVIDFPEQDPVNEPIKTLTVHTCGGCGNYDWHVIIDNGSLVCTKCSTTLKGFAVVDGDPEPVEGFDGYAEIVDGPEV